MKTIFKDYIELPMDETKMSNEQSSMSNPSGSNIIDGEVVGTSKTVAEDVMTVSSLIQNYLGQIEKQESELKENRQMLEDAFNNDPTYREHNDKVKEATKVRNATKAQIMKQPAVMELANKVKEMRTALKEAKEALSSYLQEYARMTGEQSFEGPDGEVRQIVYTARLVKVGKA